MTSSALSYFNDGKKSAYCPESEFKEITGEDY